MKTHQKMCWSCDGHVHVYELQCPFCGAELAEEEKQELKRAIEWAQEETSFQEPFFEKNSSEEREEMQKELEHPPFENLIQEIEEAAVDAPLRWEERETPENRDLENPLASLLLLLPGSLFFLFGLALFLFSHDGILTFKFSSKYWFIYLLGSWPVLYFGWRSLFPAEPKYQEESETLPESKF
jgi:hypothetical protein